MGRTTLVLGLMFLVGTVAQSAEPWRQQALRAAERLAVTIELLDESLHEAHGHNPTPQFTKAIQDIHHIEKVLQHLHKGIPAAPVVDLCRDMAHLHEDLVQIRLDLIALGLEKNPKVVQNWNSMAHVYNRQLSPIFRTCPPSLSDEPSVPSLDPL